MQLRGVNLTRIKDPPTLAQLTARALAENNPIDYQNCQADHFIHNYGAQEYKNQNTGEGPYFDAFLARTVIWDSGEISPFGNADEPGFRATGRWPHSSCRRHGSTCHRASYRPKSTSGISSIPWFEDDFFRLRNFKLVLRESRFAHFIE